jgi:hypothetical protein
VRHGRAGDGRDRRRRVEVEAHGSRLQRPLEGGRDPISAFLQPTYARRAPGPAGRGRLTSASASRATTSADSSRARARTSVARSLRHDDLAARVAQGHRETARRAKQHAREPTRGPTRSRPRRPATAALGREGSGSKRGGAAFRLERPVGLVDCWREVTRPRDPKRPRDPRRRALRAVGSAKPLLPGDRQVVESRRVDVEDADRLRCVDEDREPGSARKLVYR